MSVKYAIEGHVVSVFLPNRPLIQSIPWLSSLVSIHGELLRNIHLFFFKDGQEIYQTLYNFDVTSELGQSSKLILVLPLSITQDATSTVLHNIIILTLV